MNKILKTVPFYLLLLPVFFCLHGALENFGLLKPDSLVNLGFHIFEGILVAFAVIWLITRKLAYSGIVTFCLSAWYLFFGAMVDFVKETKALQFLNNFSVILLGSLLMLLVICFLLRKKLEVHSKINYFLNILLIVYCMFDAGLIFFKQKNLPAAKQVSIKPFDHSSVRQKPNVYHLLFDEYPGNKGLIDSFTFNNDKLYSFFSKNQFKELPVFANYNSTFYSMSSVFNMQYVEPLLHPLAIRQEDYQLRKNEIADSKVISCFMAMNYSIYNLSAFDINTPSHLDGFHFPFDRTSMITDKILYYRALSYYGRYFTKGKFKIPFFRKYFMGADTWNQGVELKLNEIVSLPRVTPKYTYAHFFLPHAPVFRDSAGRYQPDEVIFGPVLKIKKEYLLDYIKYTNTKIEAMVNNIIAKDPTAIILVMSDHGLRHYNSPEPYEPLFFDNICFVRFPDKNYLPHKEDGSSNVNIYPYIFNCEFGQQMPYLPDSSILIMDKALEKQLQ